jgi:hypothetical protein
MEKPDDVQYEEMYRMATLLLERGSSNEVLETHLKQKSDDIVLITVVIKEAKKDYYARMRKEGNVYIGIGSALILLGFLITCFNFHSNKSFDYAMYGFTSIGISLVFVGLYKIIG